MDIPKLPGAFELSLPPAPEDAYQNAPLTDLLDQYRLRFEIDVPRWHTLSNGEYNRDSLIEALTYPDRERTKLKSG